MLSEIQKKAEKEVKERFTDKDIKIKSLNNEEFVSAKLIDLQEFISKQLEEAYKAGRQEGINACKEADKRLRFI